MKSSDLTNFLSKVMDIEDYGEDIQKLRGNDIYYHRFAVNIHVFHLITDNRISGKIFLTLPDNQRLLDRLSLSFGGEEEIRSIVKVRCLLAYIILID